MSVTGQKSWANSLMMLTVFVQNGKRPVRPGISTVDLKVVIVGSGADLGGPSAGGSVGVTGHLGLAVLEAITRSMEATGVMKSMVMVVVLADLQSTMTNMVRVHDPTTDRGLKSMMNMTKGHHRSRLRKPILQ